MHGLSADKLMALTEKSGQLMRFYEDNVIVTNEVRDRLRPSREWVVNRVKQQPWMDGQPVNQGSFYNGTSAGRPTDFDVLIPVLWKGAPFTAQTVTPYSRVYFYIFDSQKTTVSSDIMLNSFYTEVCSLFPDHKNNAQITMRRPAVSLYLTGNNVTVDLVPTIRIKDDLYIAKGSHEGQTTYVWKRCWPQRERETLQQYARDNDNMIAIIRLLKFVCKRNELAISSHAIQSIVVRSCRNDNAWNKRAVFTNYVSMLDALLAAVRSGQLPDWVFPSENMLENLTTHAKNKAINTLQRMILLLNSGDVKSACSLVQ